MALRPRGEIILRMDLYRDFLHRLFRISLLILVPGVVYTFEDYGVVTPLDPFLFVGEPLRLYCNITNPSVREDSSSLYFEKDDQPRVSEILNTRAIRLAVQEVDLMDNGSYVCLVRTPKVKANIEVVGHQRVKVDIKPRPVVNVKCKVYNWETMTCTWDLGVRYNHPRHINVSVFWVTTDVQQDCPQLNVSSCHWDVEHYSHGAHYNMLIVVSYRVKGHVKDEALRKFKVNSVEVVEPAPVEKLRALPRNSSCVALTWDVPRVMHRPKIFIQQIKAPNCNWSDINILPTSKTHENYSAHESLVCDLDPNTPYDFRVAVLPAPLDDGRQVGFRSLWESVFARTDEDVPSAAPATCPGCYFDLSDDDNSQDSTAPRRKVKIMWKDIPKSDRHGTLTHYRISYIGLTSDYNNSIKLPVKDSAKSVTSAVLDLPSSQEDYSVRIVGATAKGESYHKSHIFVPSLEKKPQPPHRFLVKRNGGESGSKHLFLSWAAPASIRPTESPSPRSRHHLQEARVKHDSPSLGQTLKDIYIVWCPGSRISWQCEGELEWVRLPPEQVTYELVTGLAQLDPYDLLIGITAQEMVEQNIISSGIHWSTCVYTRHQKPETAPLNVRFSPTSAGDDSLVVVWEQRGCREETSYITEYLVRYCPSSPSNKCVGDWLTVNVSSEETSVTLPHLASSTKYLVHVVAVSSAGLGPPSDDIWHMIEPEPPDEDVSGLIAVILTIISVLFVLCSCFCLARYCYRKKQKVPTVNGLLDIEPTQKCRPVYHYQSRPLPAPPPADVFVDHHTYGTSCDRTIMNNLGYDKKSTHPESGETSQEGAGSNIPLMSDLDHGGHIDKYVQQGASEEVPQSDTEGTELLTSGDKHISLDRDSAFSASDYTQRTSSPSPASSGKVPNSQRMCLDGAADSSSKAHPVWSNYVDSTAQDFSDTCTLPVRGHWPVIPDTFHQLATCGQDMGPTSNSSTGTPGYVRQMENRPVPHVITMPDNFEVNPPHQPATIEYHQHNLPPGAHLSHPASGSVCEEDFCTCDNSSEDTNINDNLALHSKVEAFPVLERRPSIAIEAIFACIPPPPGPPSPTPPYDNAPPLPTDAESRFPMNPRQERAARSPAMGSQEYLEPQVIPSGCVHSIPSGYVPSFAS